MAIYLVQHGVSLPKETDPERGLSQEGKDKVALIAEVAASYKVSVTQIFHSGKKRARETAEIFEAHLKPINGVAGRIGLSPMDDVSEFAKELDSEADTMFVGHLPFMERLVSQLTTGSDDFRPFKFQNGGIVCIDRDDADGLYYVKWALMPIIN